MAANAVSAERLRALFYPRRQGFQVTKQLREAVLFAQQNLVTDPPFSRLDLISCHNLLIYLETELQKRVIELFHFALKPGGYLFLGKSESIGHEQSLFELVSKKWRIYRSIGATRQIPVDPLLRERSAGSTRPDTVARGELCKRNARAVAGHACPAAVLVNHDYQTLYFSAGPSSTSHSPPARPAISGHGRSELRPKLRAALQRR
jgi:two-component system CheB/CheR fusion protein